MNDWMISKGESKRDNWQEQLNETLTQHNQLIMENIQ
jgi:hypothetical protein